MRVRDPGDQGERQDVKEWDLSGGRSLGVQREFVCGFIAFLPMRALMNK